MSVHSLKIASSRPLARLALGLACTACLSPAFADTDCPRPNAGGVTPNRVVMGLTAQQALVRFKTCEPEHHKLIGSLSGLTGADTMVLAVDFRVQDGKLYGLANAGGVYTIDVDTAVATKATQLTLPLDGNRFVMDFNPAANALRVVSDIGQNLRHTFEEPPTTFADTAVNYTPGTPAVGIAGLGYTNNDLDVNTGTSLFDIDAMLNQVALQAPANAGSLSVAGKLGVDPEAPIGFDIHSRLAAGSASVNVGFASMSVAGVAGFYRIDLLTGRATLLGTPPSGLVDIAVQLDS